MKSKKKMTLDQTIGLKLLRSESRKIFDLPFPIRIFEAANLILRITPLKDVLKRGSPGLRNVEKNHNRAGPVHCALNVADITCQKRTIL